MTVSPAANPTATACSSATCWSCSPAAISVPDLLGPAAVAIAPARAHSNISVHRRAHHCHQRTVPQVACRSLPQRSMTSICCALITHRGSTRSHFINLMTGMMRITFISPSGLTAAKWREREKPNAVALLDRQHVPLHTRLPVGEPVTLLTSPLPPY